jgi:hypothetical protein
MTTRSRQTHALYESTDMDGSKKFVVDHIKEYEKVLQRLEDANLTFSGEKSTFD